MYRLTGTRRRKTATITAALFLLIVASAFGYYLLIWNGTGSGSTTVGAATETGSLTLSAKLPEGLKPGQSGTASYFASNPTGKSTGYVVELHRGNITVDAEHAAAGCKASWFTLSSPNALLETLENTPGYQPMPGLAVPVGGALVALGTDTLTFTNASENQEACIGATISVALTSSSVSGG
jgi:hypothetical protein